MIREKNFFRNIALTTVLLIGISAGGYYLWKIESEETIIEEESTDGSAPSKEELELLEEYEKNCPVQTLIFEAETDSFNVIHVECSEDERYADIPEGEDITVEIYTENFEEGKESFRNWLTENGLEESEKLRVEYIHKP